MKKRQMTVGGFGESEWLPPWDVGSDGSWYQWAFNKWSGAR